MTIIPITIIIIIAVVLRIFTAIVNWVNIIASDIFIAAAAIVQTLFSTLVQNLGVNKNGEVNGVEVYFITTLVNRELVSGPAGVTGAISAAGIRIRAKGASNSTTYYTSGKFSTVVGVL